jgi:two-component system, cell cycle sensor histidine kinase and response regulator CckA
LLLTDVIMPEMNGSELSDQITALYPDLKTLFMSGYTANVIAHQGILEKDIHFIEKPLTIDVLAAKVRQILDSQ